VALAGWPAASHAAEPEPPELHPPDLADGLAVSAAGAAHLDTRLLTALGETVRKGELQKITSEGASPRRGALLATTPRKTASPSVASVTAATAARASRRQRQGFNPLATTEETTPEGGAVVESSPRGRSFSW
jgi:hypothetical protein